MKPAPQIVPVPKRKPKAERRVIERQLKFAVDEMLPKSGLQRLKKLMEQK